MERISIPVQVSILNPADPSEVTLIADAVSVGITLPTAKTGRMIKWGPDVLRQSYQSLIGKPVTVELSLDGPAGHSNNVIGTVTHAFWDETLQKIRIHAALWRHYFPETIAKLSQFFIDGKLQVSAEVYINDGVSEDDLISPTDASFSGLAIVGKGADLGNRVLMLASALESDRAKLSQEVPVAAEVQILPRSYEWLGEQIAEYIASKNTEATIIGTFNSAFYYMNGDKRYRVEFTFDDERLDFAEPVEATTEIAETVNFASRNGAEEIEEESNMTDLAELEASKSQAEAAAEEWKAKFEELSASVAAEKAVRDSETLSVTRLAEIESIAPYKDATLKEEHRELFKTADERTFEAVKKLFLAAVEPKGGITPDATIETPDDDDDDPEKTTALKNLPKWREEASAFFALAETK